MIERVFSRLSLAGLCATLVGNGIGRFAFIALMPALIQAGWFSKADATYLGVATLVGYVAGAALSNSLAARFSSARLLRASMLVCSLSFLACAVEGAGLPWYYLWRTAAGVCGAILMVLPAPVVLPRHEASIRARTSGVVFSGIGLGAAVSGFLVPLLIAGFAVSVPFGDATAPLLRFQGVTVAWLGLGVVCLALTALAWRSWPAESTGVAQSTAQAPLPEDLKLTVGLILVAHGLNAVGYLAHTMFLPDYVVRELGMPLATGGFFWSMFGLGAAIGPMLAGTLADMVGLKRCLITGFALKAFSAILPGWSSSPAALLVSSILMGLCTPGIVALVSAYALDRVGTLHHRQAWGMATSSFAMAQAVGGALMAFAATRMDSYHALFCVSATALLGSVICVALIRERASCGQAGSSHDLSPIATTAPHP
ncbi:MAG: YbfB/YjiJ family MFS transporter [Betaproteobacteria bacterium]